MSTTTHHRCFNGSQNWITGFLFCVWYRVWVWDYPPSHHIPSSMDRTGTCICMLLCFLLMHAHNVINGLGLSRSVVCGHCSSKEWALAYRLCCSDFFFVLNLSWNEQGSGGMQNLIMPQRLKSVVLMLHGSVENATVKIIFLCNVALS